ncbi:hypothetical protein K8I61_07650 [bacterium]|nr:hypothetical protein [bacterium]
MLKFPNFRVMVFAALAALAFCLPIACESGGGGDDDASVCEAAPGVICTFAGNGVAALGADGVPPEKVSLYLPMDMTWGPDGLAYIIDWNNHRIRRIVGGEVETYIGTGELGDAPDGPALETSLNHPTHIRFSPQGTVILSAWHNSKVMEMDTATGAMEAICGDGQRAFAGEGVPAIEALVDLPVSTAFDGQGRMYIMDQANQRIRRVDQNGVIDTVVGPVGTFVPDGYVEVCEPVEGGGEECRVCREESADDPNCTRAPSRPQGFRGDAVPGAEVYMNQPVSQSAAPSAGMEMGPDDVLYFTDTGNHLVRALDPDGTVRTVAGVNPAPYDATELDEGAPKGAFSGDGGPATEARFYQPRDVAIAPDGTIFVADKENSCVRRIGPDGVVDTYAGLCGDAGDEGDGGPAIDARLSRPYGVELDPAGNLYIADTYNHRIRVVYAAE